MFSYETYTLSNVCVRNVDLFSEYFSPDEFDCRAARYGPYRLGIDAGEGREDALLIS